VSFVVWAPIARPFLRRHQGFVPGGRCATVEKPTEVRVLTFGCSEIILQLRNLFDEMCV
jgi:hypothetical protein